jgi:hypothetical protein
MKTDYQKQQENGWVELWTWAPAVAQWQPAQKGV